MLNIIQAFYQYQFIAFHTLLFSKAATTLAWNLGHKNRFLTNRFFIILSTKANPEVNA